MTQDFEPPNVNIDDPRKFDATVEKVEPRIDPVALGTWGLVLAGLAIVWAYTYSLVVHIIQGVR